MKTHDLHKMLGIDKSAPEDIIKKKFREFAKNNHPDFFPGDLLREERFKKLSSAYHDWKAIQEAVREIRRLRQESSKYPNPGFKPWSFSVRI